MMARIITEGDAFSGQEGLVHKRHRDGSYYVQVRNEAGTPIVAWFAEHEVAILPDDGRAAIAREVEQATAYNAEKRHPYRQECGCHDCRTRVF